MNKRQEKDEEEEGEGGEGERERRGIKYVQSYDVCVMFVLLK